MRRRRNRLGFILLFLLRSNRGFSFILFFTNSWMEEYRERRVRGED